MLARRRKLQDDDEPLVPHGLVGQALDPAETNNSDPRLVEDSSDAPPAPEKGEDRDPRLPKPPRSTATAQPANPSPGRLLHWPRVKQQLGESRAHIAAAFPSFRAFPKQISGQVASLRGRLQSSRRLSQIRALAASRAEQVREELKSVREHAIPELQQVRDSAQVPAKVARLRQGISTAATNSKQIWQVWRTNAVRPVQTIRQRLSTGTRKSIEICRVWRAKTAEQVRAWRERRRLAKRTAWTEVVEKSPRDGFKLRVRLAGLPLKMRLAIARAKLEWQLGYKSFSKDSRLWTSIALGGFAALLVMALFSTARHFAQASLPSNRVSANSFQETTSSASTATMGAQPAAAPAKRPLRKPAFNANTQTRAPKTKATVSKPNGRQKADSDYVAKDTYVYYGSRSSR